MHKTIFLFLIVIALGSITACKRTLPDFGHTAVEKMANNWWVTVDGSAGHYYFATYNASSNSADSLWIDDINATIGLKALTVANYAKLTFSATLAPNQDQADSVSVFNGKVITLGGHSKSGVATDSLYLQVVFSDDPGDTTTIAGTARTGLIEDDY